MFIYQSDMLIIIQFLISILRKNAGRGCIRNSLDRMWNNRVLFLNIGLAVVYFAQYVRLSLVENSSSEQEAYFMIEYLFKIFFIIKNL